MKHIITQEPVLVEKESYLYWRLKTDASGSVNLQVSNTPYQGELDWGVTVLYINKDGITFLENLATQPTFGLQTKINEHARKILKVF